MESTERNPRPDWLAALEQARCLVSELGLEELLALPPAQKLAGLKAWRQAHRL